MTEFNVFKEREGEEEDNERHGKRLATRGREGGRRPQTGCDGSVSLEEGEITEERENGRDQSASQIHGGAAEEGKWAMRQLYVLSAALDTVNKQTPSLKRAPFKQRTKCIINTFIPMGRFFPFYCP